MSYDEVEIEDMVWDEKLQAYTYSCPCGDLFHITLEELKMGEDIARCPSCSLYITVIYDPEDYQDARPPEPPKPGPQQEEEQQQEQPPPPAALPATQIEVR